MQTDLAAFIKNTPAGREAQEILGKCVHCGFCTATCPTYQLLGNELDGPRGRIYLMKSLLEGAACSGRTRLHLDRCLTCRSCETTCPSGVQYGRLLEIGRQVAEKTVPRPSIERMARWLLRKTLTSRLFPVLLGGGRLVRLVVPQRVARHVPPRQSPGAWPSTTHSRRMIILDGCVQPAINPNINAAAARVLDRVGISLMTARGAKCCGALSLHLSAETDARRTMKRNIDAWWPLLQSGAEAVVMTASGCGVTVREYGQLLADDPEYADKARQVSAATRDLSEILDQEHIGTVNAGNGVSVAFHSPCTLQHGQRVQGCVERILNRLSFVLVDVKNQHLCCGAAGTYALLQPKIARKLRKDKLGCLQEGRPQVIATANIGCQVHLAGESSVPVRHWIELVDSALTTIP